MNKMNLLKSIQANNCEGAQMIRIRNYFILHPQARVQIAETKIQVLTDKWNKIRKK